MQSFTANPAKWRAAIVFNSAGEYFDDNGSSRLISNQSDLDLLLELRRQSDVIVTTGKTARNNDYSASKFAPIAFLTKNPASISEISAVRNPGAFPNIILKSTVPGLSWLPTEIERLGFRRPLFEGGPKTLTKLIETDVEIELFVSLTWPTKSIDGQVADVVKILPDVEQFEILSVFETESLRALRLIRR